jgi:hypothetical protein
MSFRAVIVELVPLQKPCESMSGRRHTATGSKRFQVFDCIQPGLDQEAPKSIKRLEVFLCF